MSNESARGAPSSLLVDELMKTLASTLPSDYEPTTAATHNRIYDKTLIQLLILWTMFVLIVVGNGLVLVALFSVRHKKSRLNFFVKHLAIADVLVGLVNVLPEVIHRHRKQFYAGMILCKVKSFVGAFVVYASVYQMVALSLDRFFAIVFPMDFMASRRRSTLMAAAAWILPGFMATPSLILFVSTTFHNTSQCIPPAIMTAGTWKYKTYSVYVVSITFFIPLLILCVCYGTMISVIWRRGKTMAPPMKSDKNANSGGVKYTGLNKKAKQDDNNFKHRSSSRGLIPRAKIKTVKMTICIVIAYILCWLPTSVFYMSEGFGILPSNRSEGMQWAGIVIQNLVYLNSATNPFIYGFFSSNICKELRRYYIIREMLKVMPCCSVSQTGYGRSTTGTVMTEFHSHTTTAYDNNHRLNHTASSNEERSVRETSHI